MCCTLYTLAHACTPPTSHFSRPDEVEHIILHDMQRRIASGEPFYKAMQQKFLEFDQDGDGFISATELRLALGGLGYNLTIAEVKVTHVMFHMAATYL